MRSRRIRAIQASLPVNKHGLTVSQLRRWLRQLPAEQRKVFRRVLDSRCSRRYDGHHLGISPGSVTRLVATLTRRLNNDMSRALITDGDCLPRRHFAVGVGRYIRGESAGEICQTLAITRHQFYLILADLRGWYFGLAAGRPARKPKTLEQNETNPCKGRKLSCII